MVNALQIEQRSKQHSLGVYKLMLMTRLRMSTLYQYLINPEVRFDLGKIIK